MTPESLRALVLNERTIVFDIASRALAVESPGMLSAHARKVEARLQQLSPETRAYIEWWWMERPSGNAALVGPGQLVDSLEAFSIHHWLYAALKGLCNEAQAEVMPEYLDHYAAALLDTDATTPMHVRQRRAVAALGSPGEVNKAFRKTHLTEAEKEGLAVGGARYSDGFLRAFLLVWAGMAILLQLRTQADYPPYLYGLIVVVIANETMSRLYGWLRPAASRLSFGNIVSGYVRAFCVWTCGFVACRAFADGGGLLIGGLLLLPFGAAAVTGIFREGRILVSKRAGRLLQQR